VTLRESLRRTEVPYLIVVPATLGVLTGVVAIGFVELINLVQWVAIGSTAHPLPVVSELPWWRLLLAPAIGGLLVGPIVHFLASETEGHGVPEVIEAVTLGGGRIRKRVAAVKALASALTIGSGGSVGREGPIVQIGAAVGSAFGQLLKLPAERLKTLAAGGAAAGIAAVFNAPIAGAFFALEVVTRNFAMPAFGPVIVASVMATVVSRAYFGDHPAFTVPPYALESAWEILAYLGLGIFCGVVAIAFIRTLDAFETRAATLPVPKIWRPALGGAVLGLMIVALPNLYGVGYLTMDRALAGEFPWQTLLLLLPAKIVATSLTLASGGSGGVFLPSLYVGAVAGGLFGTGVHALFPDVTSDSGAYALVGMAGVLAAATDSPITSILLLIEISGDYRIVLPVMIVSTIATAIARAIEPSSIYTAKLDRRGIDLRRREDVILRTNTVEQIRRPTKRIVRDQTGIGELVRWFLEEEAVAAYVVDGDGRLVGEISIHDIKNPELTDLGHLLVAGDVAEPCELVLAPTSTLADCTRSFQLGDVDEIPVVDGERKLLGIVLRRDVLRLLSSELLRAEYLGMSTPDGAAGVRELVRLSADYEVAVLPVPPALVGQSLRQANLRARFSLTVVAIRPEGADDQLPDPERPLREGDRIVVVGRSPDIARFRREGGRITERPASP
jgi:chloride channel protein, CIC family